MPALRRHRSHPLRVHLASLGCAKNLVDSEKLLARLATAGALVGAAADDADVILVNTCGFIDPARRESIAVIEEASAWKASRPGRKLFVLGCLVVRDGDALRGRLPAVDGFFGLDEHDAIVRACGLEDEETGDTRLLLTPSHTAYLRVSEGCNHGCTYCTIPSIRGPFRSRPFAEVVAEAEALAQLGVRELNLIGQDTAAYGTDRPEEPDMDGLLRRLHEVEGVAWIRLLYAHPRNVRAPLIRAIAELPKVVPYVDLPLQHVVDRILTAMNRGVDSKTAERLIARLRAEIPGVTLRTTFIVGFPGETEKEFEALLEGIERLRFDHVGAFPFSPEEGTAAARLPGRVPREVVSDRLERVYAAQRTYATAANAGRVGSVVEVLVDGASSSRGIWLARTAGQAPDVDPITFLRGAATPGTFARARIEGADELDLIASVAPGA
ncbi:MAG: 30S ribosomal protein S12 methylthiotransferase RimO [Candidatus Bipolaricaulota bacterium]